MSNEIFSVILLPSNVKLQRHIRVDALGLFLSKHIFLAKNILDVGQ